MREDRFIMRDETARRTLGGGIVIQPWAERHRRNEEGLSQRLSFLRSGEINLLLKAFLEEAREFATPIGPVFEFLNLTEDEAQQWITRTEGVIGFKTEREQLFTTAAKWQRLRERIANNLQEFHHSHPLAPGMDMEELRVKLPYTLPVKFFRDLVEILGSEGAIARDGSFVRLPGHHVQMNAEEKGLSSQVESILARNPGSPPDLKQLEKELSSARGKLSEVIRVMERDGTVVKVTTDLLFLRSYVDKVKADLYKYFSTHGEISAATFRDLIGSTRKYTIGLLEYFDRTGITTRVGDVRKLRAPIPQGTRQSSSSPEPT
jgi:selenocysteine-specific elongation factor